MLTCVSVWMTAASRSIINKEPNYIPTVLNYIAFCISPKYNLNIEFGYCKCPN